MGVAAAPEMSLRTCSGPAPPTAARGIHANHLAAADAAPFVSPEGDDEEDGGAGVGLLEAAHTSKARRLRPLLALGFAGSGSQLGLGTGFAAGRGRARARARVWIGRRWTAAI